ncbi:MAG: lysophospholipid acyltransferase family protein [Mariprofundaceae bacterium]|nr:lysophospholipid acyltransferase family protein [Mariprofundaceae bacterium]
MLRFSFYLLSQTPIFILHMMGTALGYLFYYLDRGHRHTTLRNLARIFPEKAKSERICIAKASFVQVGHTLLEIPRVFMRSKEDLLRSVSIEGEDILHQALAENKGVFLMASHYSNWELMGLLPSMLGIATSTIYRPLNQGKLNTFTQQARSRFGTTMHSRRKGLRWLFSALKENQCVIVALDQHMGAGNGILAPFLGHIASTTPLPAPFVHKNNTPMVGMALERINHGFQFKLRFWRIPAPHTTEDKAANDIAVMTAACASFEDMIRTQPEQWLWMHRRWRAVETDENMRDIVHGAP